MKKILIVEDDEKLRSELKQFLINNGYETQLITNFDQSLLQIQNSTCDLILMDINIPGVNGEYLCREIRKNNSVPIIMVTSRDNEIDELMSLSYGADDYITKPYNPQILLMRIEAVLKRASGNESLILTYRELKLNVSKGVIVHEGNEIELSKNESKIFYFLLKHKECIVTREEIMDFLWGSDEFIDDNTLTVNINRLRKRLEEIGYSDIIETRRGQGYIIS